VEIGMKLNMLTGTTIFGRPSPGHDIDAALYVAPTIQQHIEALERLLPMLGSDDELCGKLSELKNLLSSRLGAASTMIENDQPIDVILDHDPSKTLGQQRVHIHGVGSTIMSLLPTKIIREAGFVEDIIGEIDADRIAANYDQQREKYQDLTKWAEQLLRSATFLNQACLEMARKSQTVVTEKEDDVMANEASSALDSMITSNSVLEMYETLYPGLGDLAWVAIAKRLRAQGHPVNLVESALNRAVVLAEMKKKTDHNSVISKRSNG
jgi:hypothetical protein